MKKSAAQFKNFISVTFSGKTVQSVFKRATVLLMLTALLLPIIIFHPTTKVSARSATLPIVNSLPAPVSAPPTAFIASVSNTGNNFIPAIISSTVSSGYSSVIGFFSVPQLPDGFTAAQSVSPAYSYFSSVGNSISSFFGFFALSSEVEYSPPSSSGTEFDYDGDGKADPAVWHQSSGVWTVKKSSVGSGVTTTLGASAAFMTPGDYDGDSITDYAVFNSGTWSIIESSKGTVSTITNGASGDRPAVNNL